MGVGSETGKFVGDIGQKSELILLDSGSDKHICPAARCDDDQTAREKENSVTRILLRPKACTSPSSSPASWSGHLEGSSSYMQLEDDKVP